MRLGHLLNPGFIYRHRDLIVPYLERRWKLGPFRGRHRGERCFVVGNGPSLLISDLDKLKSEVSFAANKIYLAFDKTTWRPNYYVVEDDHMIRQHRNEIRGLQGPVKFVQSDWRQLFRKEPGVIFYDREVMDAADFPEFSDDPLRLLYCGYMVTYISLQLAYFMGFTRVYLLGVDFDYSLTRGTVASVEHAAGDPQDHFVPNYFSPGETRYLPLLDRAELAMKCARKFYESRGRKIWNATRGGKLEVFDRMPLEQALTDEAN
jgi:hypothetical protein